MDTHYLYRNGLSITSPKLNQATRCILMLSFRWHVDDHCGYAFKACFHFFSWKIAKPNHSSNSYESPFLAILPKTFPHLPADFPGSCFKNGTTDAKNSSFTFIFSSWEICSWITLTHLLMHQKDI